MQWNFSNGFGGERGMHPSDQQGFFFFFEVRFNNVSSQYHVTTFLEWNLFDDALELLTLSYLNACLNMSSACD